MFAGSVDYVGRYIGKREPQVSLSPVQILPYPIAGLSPRQPPSPQILDESGIPDRKPSKLARRHPVLRKIGLDLIQKLHWGLTHFRLVFMLCSV